MNKIMKSKFPTDLVTVILIFLIILTGCKDSPRVISTAQDDGDNENNSGIFSSGSPSLIPEQSTSPIVEDIHTVIIEEILPTTKYVYLRVKEGQDEFWIATNKMEVKPGGIYFYRGGLLKTNFESKEYNRVFERMYLVSTLVEADHGNTLDSGVSQEQEVNTGTSSNVDTKGSITIAELVANPTRYEGKFVLIKGTCSKLNANIMGRNWIHLKDGSRDDYDLVITSDLQVPVGHTVTMRGKVVLNKDFGAGYQYDILLEDGVVVQ